MCFCFQALQDDPELDDVIFQIGDFEISDLAEQQGLVYHIGYIVKKTICTQSHCQHCIDLLTTSEDNQELRHSLILEKAYTEGAFILPSKLACDVLESANAKFMTNRNQFSKAPRTLDKFIDWLKEDLAENFPDFPLCHLDLILRRFFKVRMYFWARFLDAQLQKEIKDQKTKNYGSRTMQGYHMNKI